MNRYIYIIAFLYCVSLSCSDNNKHKEKLTSCECVAAFSDFSNINLDLFNTIKNKKLYCISKRMVIYNADGQLLKTDSFYSYSKKHDFIQINNDSNFVFNGLAIGKWKLIYGGIYFYNEKQICDCDTTCLLGPSSFIVHKLLKIIEIRHSYLNKKLNTNMEYTFRYRVN